MTPPAAPLDQGESRQGGEGSKDGHRMRATGTSQGGSWR